MQAYFESGVSSSKESSKEYKRIMAV